MSGLRSPGGASRSDPPSNPSATRRPLKRDFDVQRQMKSLVVFDLDGTLAPSKSSLDAEMAALLGRLLGIVKVAVISGGAWTQFEKQVLAFLPHDERLKSLSMLPTCGTKFYRFDGDWKKLYSEDFSADDKKKIISALNQAVDRSGFRADKHWGDLIEDRDSQITFSALGQAGAVGREGEMGSRLRQAPEDRGDPGAHDSGVLDTIGRRHVDRRHEARHR